MTNNSGYTAAIHAAKGLSDFDGRRGEAPMAIQDLR